MKDQIAKNWYLVLIKGIIMVLLALLVLTSPAGTLLTYVVWIGIGVIINGIMQIVQGIASKDAHHNWGWVVFGGAIDIFFGLILMAHPGITLTILPIMIGFWAAFYGLSLMIDGFSSSENKGMKIIFGILILIIANTIIFNPIAFGLTMAIWFGVILLFAGIFSVIISFKIKGLATE